MLREFIDITDLRDIIIYSKILYLFRIMHRTEASKKPSKANRGRAETADPNAECLSQERPKPSFPTDCDNDLFSKKIPEKPDEPISLEDLTRAKSDVRGIHI